MPKYYKVLISTTYMVDRVIKANSQEEAEEFADSLLNKIDLMNDDDPQIETTVYERDDYDDDDVNYDLTK